MAMKKQRTQSKRRKVHGGGISGTRTKIDDKTPLKGFIVSEKAALCDNLGIRRDPGETAMLDEATANFMAKRGYLDIEIKFDDGTTPAAEAKEIADADEAAKAEDADDGDQEKTGRRVAAKPVRGKSGGGNEPPASDEAILNAVVGDGRKRSL